MSVRATTWAWRQKITSTEKLVLLELCDHVNDKHNHDACWPDQDTIASRTGFTPRTVHSALKSLEKRGLIKRQRRMIGGQRTSDWITVLIDGPKGASLSSDPIPSPTPPEAPPTATNSDDNQKELP